MVQRRESRGTPGGGRFASSHDEGDVSLTPLDVDEHSPEFVAVLESAARLQQIVPDAVMVGGSAVAVHARHRLSTDHDHVVADLHLRFEAVLEAVEADGGWQTNRVVASKVILGNLDGIETGVRQMIRKRPLETEVYRLPSGSEVVVPTVEEALRVKAFLVVKRNMTRDYLDCAALSDRIGVQAAARVLSEIDDYYADQIGAGEGVATQVARQFADPRPKDTRVTKELPRYKKLNQRWTKWAAIRDVLADVAVEMVEMNTADGGE